MKATFSVFLILCGSILNIHSVNADQFGKGFYFSHSKLECTGLNPKTWHECSDLTHLNLQRGKYRNRLERPRIRLTGSNLEGRDLSRIHFQSADLSYINLRNSTLHNTVFENTNLRGVDFQGADLSGAKFVGSVRLHGSKFNHKSVFSTICDDDGICGENFAFRHGMIYQAPSGDVKNETVIAGKTIELVTWNSESNSGSIKLGVLLDSHDDTLKFLAGHSSTYIISDPKLYNRLKKYSIGEKVKIYVSDQTLIDIETLIGQ